MNLKKQSPSLECGVCMDKKPVICMPCCQYKLCLNCGPRILSRKQLKCPQCRVMHPESVLEGELLFGEVVSDDLSVVLAASLLAHEEDEKSRSVAEAEWAQQLSAALSESMAFVVVDDDLEAAIRVSKRVRNWEDDQLEWAGCVVGDDSFSPEFSLVQASLSKASLAQASLVQASLSKASIVPMGRSRKRVRMSEGKAASELTGFKLIRCRDMDGKRAKTALKLSLGGDVEADVSMKAALELSMRPKWLERQHREMGVTGLEKMCCNPDGSSQSSSCTCVKQ